MNVKSLAKLSNHIITIIIFTWGGGIILNESCLQIQFSHQEIVSISFQTCIFYAENDGIIRFFGHNLVFEQSVFEVLRYCTQRTRVSRFLHGRSVVVKQQNTRGVALRYYGGDELHGLPHGHCLLPTQGGFSYRIAVNFRLAERSDRAQKRSNECQTSCKLLDFLKEHIFFAVTYSTWFRKTNRAVNFRSAKRSESAEERSNECQTPE